MRVAVNRLATESLRWRTNKVLKATDACPAHAVAQV